MPYEQGTLTDEDVAAELGSELGLVQLDPARLAVATDAARSWAQDRVAVTPDVLWSHPTRHRGGVFEGCYQYLLRAAPQMQASFDVDYQLAGFHQKAEQMINPDPVVA